MGDCLFGPNCENVLKDFSFYLKFIAWCLCVAAAIMYLINFDWCYYTKAAEMVFVGAVYNSILALGVIMILMIIDAMHYVTELCFLILESVLCIIAGTLFFTYMDKDPSLIYILVASFTMAAAAFMLLAVIVVCRQKD